MNFGFYLPMRGHTAIPEALETLVTRSEALGFHSVMIADHVVFPPAERQAGLERRPFSGSPAKVVEDIASYGTLGVSELIFDFPRESLNQSLERTEHFASVIKPAADRL
jgi:alkanesulfonate monooxygenase SsuD/methylene tetrahydromethanopterin reductase-like flavin-dependent oxidoreductase (luciferase family)